MSLRLVCLLIWLALRLSISEYPLSRDQNVSIADDSPKSTQEENDLGLSRQTIAIFSLDETEGVAYLQVHRVHANDSFDGPHGWVEVWQEGHRLMLNTTDDEVAITVTHADTYLWASVFDAAGQW